jgi:hypothetical protein
LTRAVCIGGPCDGQRFEIPDYSVKQGDTYQVRIPETLQYSFGLFEHRLTVESQHAYIIDILAMKHNGHTLQRAILRDPTLSISGAFLRAIDGYGGRS